MYTKARVKLTILFSVSFLVFAWLLSFGMFIAFQQSLGEGYISQIKGAHTQTPQEASFDTIHRPVITMAGKIAVTHLMYILLIINGGLVIIIPVTSWFVISKMLNPIEKTYDQQKQFVTDASHELRTPLAILSGEMELALKKERSAADYRQTIESSKEEIDRLVDLVQNLLFLARNEYEGQRILIQEIDLTDVISSVIGHYENRIAAKNIKLDFRPAEEIQIIRGSQSMLQTLFSNLLDNAIKYTPNRGHVTISILPAGNNVMVHIKDTGIGIPQTDLKKIFYRFYRLDSIQRKTRGFGLGLSITKQIIEMHHGSISVMSKKNKGTVFTVTLPKS